MDFEKTLDSNEWYSWSDIIKFNFELLKLCCILFLNAVKLWKTAWKVKRMGDGNNWFRWNEENVDWNRQNITDGNNDCKPSSLSFWNPCFQKWYLILE